MQLVVQNGPDAGKTFEINTPVAIVGRQVGSDILLNDTQVSRRHAQIENQNGVAVVTDLGSANGSYINGQRMSPSSPVTLRSGDSLRFGDTSTVFQDNPVPVQPPAYQGYTAPTYQQPPAQPQPNYQDYNAPVYQQPPVQPQNFQQPPAYQQPMDYQQPPAYQQPQPGFQQPPAYPGYTQPAYQPPPVKKGNGGLIALLLVGLLVIVGGVIALVVLLGGNKTTTGTDTAGVNSGGTLAPTFTTNPVTTTPPPQGLSGSNPPPPSPGPLTTAASSGVVNNFGVTVTMPSNWTTRTSDQGDISKIESVGPSGEFAVITRFVGLPGDIQTRATSIVTVLKKNYPDLNVTKQESNATPSGGVVIDMEYTNPRTNNLTREVVVIVENTAKDTYVVEFGSEKSKFETVSASFNTILDSIKLN
jgi:hypothetical protein